MRGDASFAESEGERARPFDVPDELRLAAAALAHDHDGHAALEADENRRHLEHRVAGHAVPPVEQSGAVLVGAEDAGDDRQHLGVLLAQRVEVLPDVEAVKLLDKATERTRIMQSELWAWSGRVGPSVGYDSDMVQIWLGALRWMCTVRRGPAFTTCATLSSNFREMRAAERSEGGGVLSASARTSSSRMSSGIELLSVLRIATGSSERKVMPPPDCARLRSPAIWKSRHSWLESFQRMRFSNWFSTSSLSAIFAAKALAVRTRKRTTSRLKAPHSHVWIARPERKV